MIEDPSSPFNTVPVPGFKKYRYNVLTRQIFNKKGMAMKIRNDSKGVEITNLVCDEGKQRTVRFHIIVRKILESLDIWTGSDMILSGVLLAYYKEINTGIKDLNLVEVVDKVTPKVPASNVADVGRILVQIHSSL